jgi:hypothetical protein
MIGCSPKEEEKALKQLEKITIAVTSWACILKPLR